MSARSRLISRSCPRMWASCSSSRSSCSLTRPWKRSRRSCIAPSTSSRVSARWRRLASHAVTAAARSEARPAMMPRTTGSLILPGRWLNEAEEAGGRREEGVGEPLRGEAGGQDGGAGAEGGRGAEPADLVGQGGGEEGEEADEGDAD